MTEPLWDASDLRAFLRVRSARTFSRIKKTFPRVVAVLPLERYDPETVRAIVQGDTPAQKHRAVSALRKVAS